MLADEPDSLSRGIVTLCLDEFNQGNEVLDSRLVFGWNPVGLIVAKLEQWFSTGMSGEGTEECRWKAMR